MKTNRVVGIGDVLWDVFPDRKTMGGTAANACFHLSQLGIDATLVSAIGDDPLGSEIHSKLERKGVKSILETSSFPTSTVSVELDRGGMPSYTIVDNIAWDHLTFTDEIRRLAEGCDAVCFGTLAQRCPVSQATILRFLQAMPEGSLRMLDLNLRSPFYSREVIDESIRLADLLKVNEEELAVLTAFFDLHNEEQTACRRLMETYGLQTVVLTKGEGGSVVFAGDTVSVLPAQHVEVVDTVGAGDAFTAAFLAAHLNAWGVEEAHRLAVEISAFVCTRPGGMPELPIKFRDILK